MNTGRYSIKNLFTSTEIEQIIIPEIQRDYVWKDSNVRGLMESIIKHFSEKESLELDIVVRKTGKTLDMDVTKLLSEEYTRMVHSTRIGFIYAYHSPDYPGKFFLIDGQQRLTTIFLLLLAAYKGAGWQDSYIQQYFKSGLPKLDYKVREVTHDFMVDFIRHETGATASTPFTESELFYEYYNKDVTTSSLLNNYNVIEEMLIERCLKWNDPSHFYEQFVNYVENYIEFNYFDTNISETGEKLYLYMNSRGEGLSDQESLRPLLIGRSDKKLEAGEKWEDWQNFFWLHRGNNKNADPGFQEFLKWCTFLHICLTDSPITYNGETHVDTKGNYIRKEKPGEKLDQQLKWIRQYQKENAGFNIDFIDKVFFAVKSLAKHLEQEIKYSYVPSGWLSEIGNTSDYPCLMACLTYLYYNPVCTLNDVRRVGMFIKNCMYGDTNRKNPEDATVNTVAAVKALHDVGYVDIMSLELLGNNVSKTIFTPTDSLKRKYCLSAERSKWEELFWTVTNDGTFSRFLDGNILCLLEWADYKLADFKKYYDALNERIIKIVLSRTSGENIKLHKNLLGYGDFAIQYGHGNDGHGNIIPRYYMLYDENEWKWGINDYASIRNLIKQYLDGAQPACKGELYKMFIDENATNQKNILEYVEYFEFLKDDSTPPRFILPRIFQISGDNFRELMVQWVHQHFKDSWVVNRDNVHLAFEIQNGQMTFVKKDDKAFQLCMSYDWNKGHPYWKFRIKSGGKAIAKEIEKLLSDWDDKKMAWAKVAAATNGTDEIEYPEMPDDTSKSVHERTKDVSDFVKRIVNCINHQIP